MCKNNHFLVSCLESRVEENGKLYGKFFIGPCNPGQGITLGTALRRNLLSEISGIGIIAAEIKGADHEYCSLPGVRESVLDIILNLKGLALAGDIVPEEPCIGFLDVFGPAEVKASDIKFPLGISPLKKDHHIATVSYDGKLSVKVFLIKGKNYMIHNPSTIPQIEGLKLISSPRKKKKKKRENSFQSNSILFTEKAPSFFINASNPFQNQNELKRISQSHQENKLQQSKIQLKSFWDYYSQKDPFSAEKLETSIYLAGFLELLERNSLEYKYWKKDAFFATKNEISPIPSFQKKVLKNWKIKKENFFKPRRAISEGFSNLFKKQENLFYYSSPSPPFAKVSSKAVKGQGTYSCSSILPVDGLFLPVEKVNFRVETDVSGTNHLILEIWTNGAVHPRQALYESAENLITILSHFHIPDTIADQKDLFSELQLKRFELTTILSKSTKRSLIRMKSNLLSKTLLLKRNNTYNLFEKTDLLEISDPQIETDEVVQKPFYSLDIANICLPLSLFITLKKLKIHTIHDLAKGLSTGFFNNLEEKEINILKIALRQIL